MDMSHPTGKAPRPAALGYRSGEAHGPLRRDTDPTAARSPTKSLVAGEGRASPEDGWQGRVGLETSAPDEAPVAHRRRTAAAIGRAYGGRQLREHLIDAREFQVLLESVFAGRAAPDLSALERGLAGRFLTPAQVTRFLDEPCWVEHVQKALVALPLLALHCHASVQERIELAALFPSPLDVPARRILGSVPPPLHQAQLLEPRFLALYGALTTPGLEGNNGLPRLKTLLASAGGDRLSSVQLRAILHLFKGSHAEQALAFLSSRWDGRGALSIVESGLREPALKDAVGRYLLRRHGDDALDAIRSDTFQTVREAMAADEVRWSDSRWPLPHLSGQSLPALALRDLLSVVTPGEERTLAAFVFAFHWNGEGELGDVLGLLPEGRERLIVEAHFRRVAESDRRSLGDERYLSAFAAAAAMHRIASGQIEVALTGKRFSSVQLAELLFVVAPEHRRDVAQSLALRWTPEPDAAEREAGQALITAAFVDEAEQEWMGWLLDAAARFDLSELEARSHCAKRLSYLLPMRYPDFDDPVPMTAIQLADLTCAGPTAASRWGNFIEGLTHWDGTGDVSLVIEALPIDRREEGAKRLAEKRKPANAS